MNIVTPIPLNVPFSPANQNTESARRDNQLREVIPQPASNEESASQSGLGSDSDKVRQPGQTTQPLVYERPQVQQPQSSGVNPGNDNGQDNAEDPSAGKEDAQQRQKEQAEQQEVQELKQRDREVRAHEQAHARVGGEYAGSPQYEFELGPDGQRYAVGGKVSIDISEEDEPQDTIRKMEQVKAAALAPAEPSPADLRVAAEATQIGAQARSELAEQQQESRQQVFNEVFNPEQIEQTLGPELDDIVAAGPVTPPTRSLDEVSADQQGVLATQRNLEAQSDETRQRALRIDQLYNGTNQIRSNQLNLTA